MSSLYEEGPWVKCGFVRRAVMASGCGEVGEVDSSLYRLLEGGQGRSEFAPGRISLRAVRRPGGRWRLWERRVRRG